MSQKLKRIQKFDQYLLRTDTRHHRRQSRTAILDLKPQNTILAKYSELLQMNCGVLHDERSTCTNYYIRWNVEQLRRSNCFPRSSSPPLIKCQNKYPDKKCHNFWHTRWNIHVAAGLPPYIRLYCLPLWLESLDGLSFDYAPVDC